MKTKIEYEFDLPEEKDDLDTVINAWKYRAALEEVFQECFRSPRKYGFAGELSIFDTAMCRDFLELLKTRFQTALADNDVELP